MSSIYKIKEFVINLEDFKIQHPTRPEIELSSAEARILHSMIKQPNVVFNNETLEIIGWSGKPVSSSNLTVTIAALRKKILPIDGLIIKNRPKEGYFITTVSPIKTSGKLVNKTSKTVFDRKISHLFLSKGDISTTNISILIVNFLAIIITFMFFIPKTHLTCIDIDKRKICSIGKSEFSILNIATDINKGETILTSEENTIILDRESNIKVNIKND